MDGRPLPNELRQPGSSRDDGYGRPEGVDARAYLGLYRVDGSGPTAALLRLRTVLTKDIPLFPVTMVGSWPRSPEVLRAQRRRHHGDISAEEFDHVADAAVIEALKHQESAGIDIVTDGEQRR